MSLQQAQKQPSAVDVEETVIGAILIEPKALFEVADLLYPEVFYDIKHQMIFKAILKLHELGDQIDMITVVHRLRKEKELEAVGGALYVSKLTNRVSSSVNITDHARLLVEKFALRTFLSVSNDMRKMAEREDDPFVIARFVEASLGSLAINRKTSTKHMKEIVYEVMEDISERMKPDAVLSVPTGFNELDNIIHGWSRTDLVIVGGRPSMGKTAFVLSTAIEAAKRGCPVLIFSLEMGSKQLVGRIMSQETGMEYKYINSVKIDEERLTHLNLNIGRIDGLPIYIDDTPALSVYEFRAIVRRLVVKLGIRLVCVDYLQLMTLGEHGSKRAGMREQEISTISRTLKQTAKEANVPVIALSQLSREIENRQKSKRPTLADLRESGAIEQDADIVIFPYRDEYYGILEDEEGRSTLGVAEIIVAKHRNGSLGTARIEFIDSIAKFRNLGGHGNIPNSDRFIESSIDKPF